MIHFIISFWKSLIFSYNQPASGTFSCILRHEKTGYDILFYHIPHSFSLFYLLFIYQAYRRFPSIHIQTHTGKIPPAAFHYMNSDPSFSAWILLLFCCISDRIHRNSLLALSYHQIYLFPYAPSFLHNVNYVVFITLPNSVQLYSSLYYKDCQH